MPEPRVWIRDPLAAFDGTRELHGRGVLVEDGRIAELVGLAGPSREPDEIVEARDAVLLPGLVNGHHHFYQTLTRAEPAAINAPLFPWLQALYPLWAHLTDADVEASTALALAELLRSGCTTAVDHHYVFPEQADDPIAAQAEAARALGVRVLLTRGSMSVGEDQGGLPPRSGVQDEAAILADSERLIARHHDAAPDAHVRLALAPCSPFSVSPELMRESAALARRHGVLLHTHLGETRDENDWCLATHGQRPLDYLEATDWLAPDVWLAHGIHFDAGEIARLGAAGVGVCHCPSSNMLLGSGICPVHDLEAAGCAVGLGVDGSASNAASCSGKAFSLNM